MDDEVQAYPTTRQFLSPPLSEEEIGKLGLGSVVGVGAYVEGRRVVGKRFYVLVEIDLDPVEGGGV
jgi:hypothetical protein